MAKKKKNPHTREYNQHLKRVNIPEKKSNPTYAFESELSKGKRNKFIIAGVIAVSLIMVVSLILPYLGTATGSWQPQGLRTEETVPEKFNPSSIIANQAFNRQNKDYLVLIGTQTNINSANAVNTSSLATYFINIEEAINKEIRTNKPVVKPVTPQQISTNDLMILRIKDKKVITSIHGKDRVLDYLKKLK